MRIKFALIPFFALWACDASVEPRFEPSDAGSATRRADGGGPRTTPDGGADVCSTCGANAVCVGGECVCNIGYSGDGRRCVDVDECARGLANCPANSACVNEVASHHCECFPGFDVAGNRCEARTCQLCDENRACGSGECMQRFCDGRFGCYEESSCTAIGEDLCPSSAAWETCSTNADCATPYGPGGRLSLEFECVGLRWGSGPNNAKRCWPIIATSQSYADPGPAYAPVDCPPAPSGSTATVIRGASTYMHYEWQPAPESTRFHGTAYEACYLQCDAGTTCPSGMACRSGFCQ